MTSLILEQNIKAGQRGIQYLPLLYILDIFDNEIFTYSGEKKNELKNEIPILNLNEFNRKYPGRLQKQTLKNCS